MTQGGFDQPRLRKAHRIIGSRLVLRNAEVDDARFIWQLRRDPHRARHLSAVPDDPQAQVEWLQAYAQDDEQAYRLQIGQTAHGLLAHHQQRTHQAAEHQPQHPSVQRHRLFSPWCR